jgi:toxin ParE1/3/4
MTFDFHPEAETEFLEAIAYYESCSPGLGEDFSLEVHFTVQNILILCECMADC